MDPASLQPRQWPVDRFPKAVSVARATDANRIVHRDRSRRSVFPEEGRQWKAGVRSTVFRNTAQRYSNRLPHRAGISPLESSAGFAFAPKHGEAMMARFQDRQRLVQTTE